MPDMSSWSPALAIIFTAIAGVATYWYQRYVDRKNSLIDLRRQVYRSYLDALIKYGDAPSQKTLTAHNIHRLDLVVIASDVVMQKVGSFSNYMRDNQIREPAVYRQLLADIIFSMRKDCFEKSKLETKQIMSVLPV
jgi:hypothetical protein